MKPLHKKTINFVEVVEHNKIDQWTKDDKKYKPDSKGF